jgi:hypothetical protein
MEEDNFVDIDFYIGQLWYGETGRDGEQGEMETEHSTLSVSLSRPFPVSPPLPFCLLTISPTPSIILRSATMDLSHFVLT